jgi:hypothetical protein
MTMTRSWLSAVVCGTHRGVEPEGGDRAGNVVVDRLRHPDEVHPLVGEAVRDGQRSIPPDGNERIDAELPRVGDHLVRAVDLLEGSVRFPARPAERVPAIRGAQDGAAEVADPAHRLAGERDDVILAEQAGEAALDPEHLPPATDGAEHRGPDDRVEPRRVATARGERYPHRCARNDIMTDRAAREFRRASRGDGSSIFRTRERRRAAPRSARRSTGPSRSPPRETSRGSRPPD